jgi:hypothetical protein
MTKSTRIVVGAFLGAGFASFVLTAPISALAQSNGTTTTGQQGATGQQEQQPHKHSHQHTHQGNKSGAHPQSSQ